MDSPDSSEDTTYSRCAWRNVLKLRTTYAKTAMRNAHGDQTGIVTLHSHRIVSRLRIKSSWSLSVVRIVTASRKESTCRKACRYCVRLS
jgi:hypothetical protein